MSEGMPIQALCVVRLFKSKMEAAKFFNVGPNVIDRAVENGRQVGGCWFRYADMPPEAQPLVSGPVHGVIRLVDNKFFNSVRSAVLDFYIDGMPDAKTLHRERMALYRAVKNGTEWRGSKYRYATETEDEIKRCILPSEAA
jgi:hypothetical protein